MKDKFIALDHEKRDKMINASMAEFALRGYDKASTNEIVKEAGISKGLLFHYFRSKKELFLFLFDYGAEVLVHDFFDRINLEERDFFKKLREVLMVKLELFRRYPDLTQFMQQAYMETSPEIKRDIELRSSKMLALNTQQLFENVDASLLKPGVELTEALHIIVWSMEGMANEELKKCKFFNCSLDYAQLFQRSYQLLDSFERLFKKGGQNNECH